MSFLGFTGKHRKRAEKYIFEMKNGKKITSKFSSSICNPTYDNSFKNIFCGKKIALKSMLNSILFPKSKLIERIEYSQTYFAGKTSIKRRYGFGSKSIDIGCKCFLKKNNGLKIKNDILLIDIEMQIGFSDETEKRFIDYANKIRVDSNYEDTWVVSFILKENINKNNKIRLNKVDSEGAVNVKQYQSIKLIEISLNYCMSLIEENKEIEILTGEKLGVDGKEWIKLLSLPIWCQADDIRDDVYILPKISKKNFISCKPLKKAIEEIIYKREPFDLSEVDEHYNREERKEYFKIKKEIEELKNRNKYLEDKLKEYEENEKGDSCSVEEEEDEIDDEEEEEIDEEGDEEEEKNEIENDDDFRENNNEENGEKMDIDD